MTTTRRQAGGGLGRPGRQDGADHRAGQRRACVDRRTRRCRPGRRAGRRGRAVGSWSPARTSNPATPTGTWRIAQRVAPDRVISMVDPETRHMHKSRSEYRDGYKAHLAVEPETGLVRPGDAAGVEQDPEPVVVEMRKPWPQRFTFFTHRLRPSVGPLDAPVTWWARISERHERSVLPSDTISGTSSARQPAMALSSRTRASRQDVREVDVAHRFLGQPGAEHLVSRVADAEAEQHPMLAALVEAFVAGQQGSALLAQAVRWGSIWDNPAERAHRIVTTPPELSPPTPKELQQLLEHLDDDPVLHLFVVLAAFTGTRRAQLLGLRWSGVSLSSGRVSFTAGWVEGPSRTGPRRDEDQTPSAASISTPKRSPSSDSMLAVSARTWVHALPPDGFVFSDDPHGRAAWKPNRATKSFLRARRAAGLRPFRLHDLRHFMATQMLDAGVPLRSRVSAA